MSSNKKPVVVYGASGYTGRLVCEYLREYGIPFIAAGRSGEKIHAAMTSNVPGIETASYEVVEVIHTAEVDAHSALHWVEHEGHDIQVLLDGCWDWLVYLGKLSVEEAEHL